MTLSYSNCKNNCFSTLKRERLLKEPAACGKSVFLPMVKEKKGHYVLSMLILLFKKKYI